MSQQPTTKPPDQPPARKNGIGHIVSILSLASAICIINGFELLAGQPRLLNEIYVIAGQNIAYGGFMCWYHAKVSASAMGVNVQT